MEETEEENAGSEEEEREENAEMEEKEEVEKEEKEVGATPCPRRRINNAMKNNADDDRRTEEVP